jgi:hypothetical protein
MSYIVEIIIVIICCGGCFFLFGECCDCNICEIETPVKPNNGLVISETTSPIQDDQNEL